MVEINREPLLIVTPLMVSPDVSMATARSRLFTIYRTVKTLQSDSGLGNAHLDVFKRPTHFEREHGIGFLHAAATSEAIPLRITSVIVCAEDQRGV